MKHDVIISVVLYHNSEDQVKKLLRSTDLPGLSVKLVLIDNAPEFSEFMQQMELPEYVEYRPLPENVGYGRGHNLAILDKNLEGGYHLILNPDVYFDPKALSAIVEYMDQNIEVGLLMPKVIWPDGRDQGLRKLLPTPLDLMFRRFLPGPLKRITSNQQARYELADLSASETFDVPVLSGCFMFCRRPWLQEIGGFDERFFLYLEDVDLSRRMLMKGKNRYWPGVSVVHEYQKDSYKSGKHLQRHLSSAVKYFNKHGWIVDADRKKINLRALRQREK